MKDDRNTSRSVERAANIGATMPGDVLPSMVGAAGAANIGATMPGDVLPSMAGVAGAVNIGATMPGDVLPSMAGVAATPSNWEAGLMLLPGQMVDVYQIVDFIKSSGEAEVYRGVYEGKDYAVKIYRNQVSLKQEVSDLLEKEKHPNLARMVKVGAIQIQFPTGYVSKDYEISEFYHVVKKPLAYEELRRLIEQVNEGLHRLHEINIFHKDIKPANIMMDDKGNYRIIDFGISSVAEAGQTSMNNTKTGMSIDYASPETRATAKAGTREDYYSLGISIYELFTGELPYAELGEANNRYEQLNSVGIRVRESLNMPKELEKLIHGLTYYSNNPSQKNLRWGYEDIKKWLENPSALQDLVMGTEQEGASKQAKGDSRATTRFPKGFGYKGVQIHDSYTLADTLGSYWDESRKALGRGVISRFFEEIGSEYADFYTLCEDSREAVENAQTEAEEDLIFWKLLYQIEPKLKKFYWNYEKENGRSDYTCEEVGVYFFLNPMGNHKAEASMPSLMQQLIENKTLITYLRDYLKDEARVKKAEKYIREFKRDDSEIAAWKLGYLFAGKAMYRYHEQLFATREELYHHLIEWTNSLSLREAVEVAEKFKMTKEFQAWTEFQEEA